MLYLLFVLSRICAFCDRQMWGDVIGQKESLSVQGHSLPLSGAFSCSPAGLA